MTGGEGERYEGKELPEGHSKWNGQVFSIGRVEEEGDLQLGVLVEEGENGVRKDAWITARALCISNRVS